MGNRHRAIAAAFLLAPLAACEPESGPPEPRAEAASAGDRQTYTVPMQYEKLDNGLKVILSQDRTAPVVTVAVYYNIGFRIEPRDRTGFAHLFEHMMFQGSRNLGKMEFVQLVQRNGGVLNGSTRFDYTNFSAGLFVLRNSTRDGIINVLSYLDLHELPDSWLTNYVSNVFAVTPEEVSETARRYLREEDMTLVVVGDRGRIAEQVAPWLEGGDDG